MCVPGRGSAIRRRSRARSKGLAIDSWLPKSSKPGNRGSTTVRPGSITHGRATELLCMDAPGQPIRRGSPALQVHAGFDGEKPELEGQTVVHLAAREAGDIPSPSMYAPIMDRVPTCVLRGTMRATRSPSCFRGSERL